MFVKTAIEILVIMNGNKTKLQTKELDINIQILPLDSLKEVLPVKFITKDVNIGLDHDLHQD